MANKSISKAELTDLIANDMSMAKKDVKRVIDSMLEQVGTHLKAGTRVQLSGFGTFEVRERQARTGVRPGTTERLNIPASKYPAFKPGKSLKDTLK